MSDIFEQIANGEVEQKKPTPKTVEPTVNEELLDKLQKEWLSFRNPLIWREL